jgi:hypothetical protein
VSAPSLADIDRAKARLAASGYLVLSPRRAAALKTALPQHQLDGSLRCVPECVRCALIHVLY